MSVFLFLQERDYESKSNFIYNAGTISHTLESYARMASAAGGHVAGAGLILLNRTHVYPRVCPQYELLFFFLMKKTPNFS